MRSFETVRSTSLRSARSPFTLAVIERLVERAVVLIFPSAIMVGLVRRG